LLELEPEIELPLHGKLKNKVHNLSWQKIEKLQAQHCLMNGDLNHSQ
jgi:2-amino-4-hydroxy-6-hydroxymethyldihydropteridine diphosphokinase